jgi:hypothetical protein
MAHPVFVCPEEVAGPTGLAIRPGPAGPVRLAMQEQPPQELVDLIPDGRLIDQRFLLGCNEQLAVELQGPDDLILVVSEVERGDPARQTGLPTARMRVTLSRPDLRRDGGVHDLRAE